MQQVEVRKVVHVDLVLEHDDDALARHAHGLDLGAEGKLADAPVLVVVPDHHLVRRVPRVAAAADEGKDVATEEHLHDADAAVGEVSTVGLLEGVAVEDAEAGVRSAREAALVLVEAHIKHCAHKEVAVVERPA